MTAGSGVLSAAQLDALAQVRLLARAASSLARQRIAEVLERRVSADLVDRALVGLAGAPITLNFHPDRPATDGRTAAQALLDDGRYRNQFETGTSAGGLTAFPGGDRDRWEHDLFRGAYQRAGVTAADRPRYGGLNVVGHPDGACPRFGSCHLVLRHEVNVRATFCHGDSHVGPADLGAVGEMEAILAALLEEAAATGRPAGAAGLDPAALIGALTGSVRPPAPGRALDDYVEAQVHGPVVLERDVAAIVVDPSFAGEAAGDLLAAAGRRAGVPVRFHTGYTLAPTEVPDDFRGPAMVPLAARVVDVYGPGEHLTAAVIGRAAAALARRPEDWADWGPPTATFQHLKQLWHVLVRFGEPAR